MSHIRLPSIHTAVAMENSHLPVISPKEICSSGTSRWSVPWRCQSAPAAQKAQTPVPVNLPGTSPVCCDLELQASGVYLYAVAPPHSVRPRDGPCVPRECTLGTPTPETQDRQMAFKTENVTSCLHQSINRLQFSTPSPTPTFFFKHRLNTNDYRSLNKPIPLSVTTFTILYHTYTCTYII